MASSSPLAPILDHHVKNTTLVRAIEKLYEHRKGKVSIVSVESPIEILIDLPGVIQMPVSSVKNGEARNEAYVSALRHFKRIHPSNHTPLLERSRQLQV